MSYYRYDWKRQVHNRHLNCRFGVCYNPTTLPLVYDPRSDSPPIMDQQKEGSCTANSFELARRYEAKQQGLPDFLGSRQFLYYSSRQLENSTSTDSGCTLSNVALALALFGICEETLWPYDADKLATKPSDTAYQAAAAHAGGIAHSVDQNLNDIKAAIFSKHLLPYGLSVFESFESDIVAKTGIVPVPNLSTEKCLGGHCTALLGWNDSVRRFIGANSWGVGWGQQGFYEIPYELVLNPDMASDFTVLLGVK